MRQLHWNTIPLNRITSNSMWSDTDYDHLSSRVPFDKLRSMFTIAPATPHANDEKKKSAQPTKVSLLDVSRSRNIEIILSHFKSLPIIEVIENLEIDKLSSSALSSLVSCCIPTKEEQEALQAYKGDTSLLTAADKFMLGLVQIENFDTKLKTFAYMKEFDSNADDLAEQINIKINAAKDLRKSRKFENLLKTVLLIGNTLNKGRKIGNAKVCIEK